MNEKPYSPGIQLLLLLGISLMMHLLGQSVFGFFLMSFNPEGLTENSLQDPRVFLSFAFCMQLFFHLLTFFIFLRITGIPFRQLIYSRPLTWKAIWLIPLVLATCFLLIEGLHVLNQWLFEASGNYAYIEDYLKDQAETERLLSHRDPLMLGFSLLAMAVLPAVGEELIYRGVLYDRLVLATNNIHFSAVISGLIFAALHFQPLQLLPIAGMGVVFAYVYQYSKSIWYPIILHFLINGIQIVAHYFWPEMTA